MQALRWQCQENHCIIIDMDDVQAVWHRIKDNSRSPLLMMLILLILIVFYAIHLYNALTQTPRLQNHTIVDSHPALVIHDIAQYHLFGAYNDNLANLPVTQLQLTLEGTVFSPRQPNKGYALISSPSTPSKVYHVGDTIPGSATIYKVDNNQVILKYNGELQSLRLPVDTILLSNDGND